MSLLVTAVLGQLSAVHGHQINLDRARDAGRGAHSDQGEVSAGKAASLAHKPGKNLNSSLETP